MIRSILSIVLVAGILCGCATGSKPSQPTTTGKKAVRLEQPLVQAGVTNKPAASSAKPNAGESKPNPSATSDNSLGGKVATFNSAGRFVVLDFPAGRMPVLEQTMFVYRNGLKVGEVKITGPTRDNNTVADLSSGVANKGDEVRDR
jgi:hypothetical protein